MKYKNHLIAGMLLLSFIFPSFSYAQTSFDETAYRNALLELIASLQKQIELLLIERDSGMRQLEDESLFDQQSVFDDQVDMLAIYQINTPGNVSQIKNSTDRRYFNTVFDLIPDEYDGWIREVAVFAASDADYDAFVETYATESNSWRLAVNEESIEEFTDAETAELIIHEFAHILSYDETLGRMAQSKNCEAYFAVTNSCPPDTSYLRKYVDEFWTSSNLNRVSRLDPTDENLFLSIDPYYKKNKKDYVSPYAATSPEEDFAETFMWFVLDKSVVSGGDADEKIEFFARSSRFRELKNEILENI